MTGVGEQFMAVDVTVFWLLLAGALLGVVGLFWAAAVFLARLFGLRLGK